MNINRSTKNYSDTPVGPAKTGQKSDMDSAEFKKAFGDQELGDIANKMADPNYTDPKMRKVGKDKLDKDAFLKLMLTQMQHQDPSNPLKSHEMAAQLAQFTSLEQLNNIHTTLEKMSSTQNEDSPLETLGLIGKMVQGDSSRFTRASGEKTHELAFKLPDSASKVKIEVKNPEGKTVKTFSLANLKQGDNRLSWNGVTDAGLEARPGDYSFTLTAEKSNGAKMSVDTAFEGIISGVKFISGQPVLMVGDKTIKLNEVQEIKMPEEGGPNNSFGGLMGNGNGMAKSGAVGGQTPNQVTDAMVTQVVQEMMRQMGMQPGKGLDVTPSGQKEATGKEEPPQENNLGDFAMSSNLMNKLNSELQEGSGGQVSP